MLREYASQLLIEELIMRENVPDSHELEEQIKKVEEFLRSLNEEVD